MRKGVFAVNESAKHMHLTGYAFSSNNRHAHIHHSAERNVRLLHMLYKGGARALVISEAQPSLLTDDEFKTLRDFADRRYASSSHAEQI
jgi:type II secretory pathway predicted ATPase ExeA